MKGTTLDAHHSSVSSSNAPWHLTKLLSMPVRSKATCDMEATWKCFLYFLFMFFWGFIGGVQQLFTISIARKRKPIAYGIIRQTQIVWLGLEVGTIDVRDFKI